MEHPRNLRPPLAFSHVPRTRRVLLRGLLLGAAGLLTACGSAHGHPVAAADASQEGAFLASADQAPPSSSSPTPAVVGPGPASATATTALPTSTATTTPMPTATDTPRPTATPTLTPTPTKIPYDAARLTDLLGESITSYAGSIPSRVSNVRLATRLIDGATIPPGAIFSFDDRVGAQTIAAGFDVAWGIVSRDGKPVTVPSVAGGICQVATTLFQAVYWSGLPIVERHNHLYWIAHYGQPPYGQLGLDATVDFPPVDFRFQNTTSDWLRVVGTYDSTHVRFRIYGVSQGWKVTSSPTRVSHLIKADRTLIRQDDPTRPAGYQLMIEAAEDGFDATIERLVTRNGAIVDRSVLTSHYDPAQNVMLVGTKGATPTATPTRATPSTTGTPSGTPTVTPQPSGTVPARQSSTPGPSTATPAQR